jgi:hypothetical protein
VIKDKVKRATKPKTKPKALTDMVTVDAQVVAPEVGPPRSNRNRAIPKPNARDITVDPPRSNRNRANRPGPPKIRLQAIQDSPVRRQPSRARTNILSV